MISEGDMLIEERLSMIERKAAFDRDIETEKQNRKQKELEAALAEVKKLELRIKGLLQIANKCIEEGVPFPSATETQKFGYGKGYDSYNFIADGINHDVGFMDARTNARSGGVVQSGELHYLGINNGGFMGKWDFYTNGEETFVQHEDTKKRRELNSDDIELIKPFLKEFDVFENAFYKWIDSFDEQFNAIVSPINHEEKLYKIFVTQVNEGKSFGTGILCQDFSSVEAAEEIGRECLIFPDSYFEIREYNAKQNIIGGEMDNGKSLGKYYAEKKEDLVEDNISYYVIEDLYTWKTNAPVKSELERFENIVDAVKRFVQYSKKISKIGDDTENDAARTTLGVNVNGAEFDVIHVRNNENVLSLDFTHNQTAKDSQSFMKVLEYLRKEPGLDKVRVHREMTSEEEKRFVKERFLYNLQRSGLDDDDFYISKFDELYENGNLNNLLPSINQRRIVEDVLLNEWDNPYFSMVSELAVREQNIRRRGR